MGAMKRKLNRRHKNAHHGSVHMLMQRLRAAMDEPFVPFKGTTEIDEASVKLPGGKIHLIGAYNVRTRRVYIEIIPKVADKAIMRDFILRVTVPGSRIYTDGTAAYPDGLHDRSHYTVIHTNFDWAHPDEMDGPDGQKVRIYVTTNRIEGSWGFIKRALLIPVTVTHKHFPRYLMELHWRINRQHNRKEAEAYTGKERRNLFLMGQLLENMRDRRLTVNEIRGDARARTEPHQVPPLNQPIDDIADNHDFPYEVELPLAA